MFDFSSFTVLLAIILAMFIVNHEEKKVSSKEKTIKTVLFERSAIRPSIVAFFVTLNYSSILSFMALYGADLKIVDIGIFFTIFALSITVSRPLLGRLADKKGYDIVLVPGLLLMNLTMLIFYKAQTLPPFILAGVIYGIGYGAVLPTTQAMSVLNVPANRRGVANGTFFIFVDLGVGLGSIIWGAVAHTVGFSLMYLSAIVPTLCALIFYLLFARESKFLEINH